jgi:hypothetical protein
MINWLGLEEQQERYKDFLREAEHDRLVQQALAGRERRDPIYRPALAWLGCRLVEWGKSLQRRYGNAPLASQLLAGRTSQ